MPAEGAPVFAVEVRSEHDYGPARERETAEKRCDYFRAGTLAVWDVAPVAETVAVYRLDNAGPADRLSPRGHRRGRAGRAWLAGGGERSLLLI